MNIYIKLFLAIISASVLFSCEKTADIDIPDNNPELVVAAFLSPQDDSIRVKLSWSKPIYYTINDNYNVDYEAGASVVVSNNSVNYLLKYDDIEKLYVSDIPSLNVGDDLKLKVTYDNDVLISECKIPVRPLYSIEYLGGSYENDGGWESYIHKVKLVCKNTQEPNYYRVNFEFTENVNGYYSEGYINNEFVELLYGESIEFKIQGDWEMGFDSLKMHIINADENYFKYHESVMNQWQSDGIFAEPGLIYNNVDGGLGIFSSYNLRKESFFIGFE